MLGCDRGLHQHVPLRVQSVPVVGGVSVLVDTAMLSYIHTMNECISVLYQDDLSTAQVCSDRLV